MKFHIPLVSTCNSNRITNLFCLLRVSTLVPSFETRIGGTLLMFKARFLLLCMINLNKFRLCSLRQVQVVLILEGDELTKFWVSLEYAQLHHYVDWASLPLLSSVSPFCMGIIFLTWSWLKNILWGYQLYGDLEQLT